MSTRGAVGFRADDKDYIAYNHSDSYPSWLGEKVAKFITDRKLADAGRLAVLKNQVRDIELVNDDEKPTPEQKVRFKGFFERVSTGQPDEWYALLRGMQGDLDAYVNEGIMLDGGADFMLGSLFCEWAYVINLDTNTLEVYEGFQTKKGKGRYAKSVKKPKGWKPSYNGEKFYYPVTLIAEIPFADVPATGFEDYLHAIGAIKLEDEDA